MNSKNLVAIETAPSSKKFIHHYAQSPRMCDIADKYGVEIYSDHRDETIWLGSNGGLCGYFFYEDVFGDDVAEKYVAEVQPILLADWEEEQKRRDEHKKWEEEFDKKQYEISKKNDEIWAKKYGKYGKRINFSAWGGSFNIPKFAVKKHWDESSVDVVVDAICRANNMVASSRACPQGQSLTNGEIDSSHYSFAMGKRCRSGGIDVYYQVWFSIPAGQ